MQKVYDGTININELNNPRTKIVNLVPAEANVLEVGCGTGFMSRYLKEEKNCSVTGIELSEEAGKLADNYCKKVIIGDIENLSTLLQIDDTFDVIIFGDVLEHLVSPKEVLKNIKIFLKADGFILISLPNIAHYSVRLRLLIGRFQYQQGGILDETHLHFFTLNTAKKLIQDAGYQIEHFDVVYKFGGKRLARIFPNLFGYQFIFKIKIRR